MNKKDARVFQKKRIGELEYRYEKEEKIRENLLIRIRNKKTIIGFRADTLEVNLDTLWNHPDLKDCEIFFPKVISKEKFELDFILPIQWEKGAYGLWEPIGNRKIHPTVVEIAIIPSLGFNKDGYRLGRGAGFYDRAFFGVDSKKMVGIGFSELFSIDFTSTDYDIRVGELVTESGVLFF